MASGKEKKIGGYTVYKDEFHMLGNGAFGKVYRAKDDVQGTTVAAKCLPERNLTEEPETVLENLRKLCHLRDDDDHDENDPNSGVVNILRCYEILQENNKIWVFMELCAQGDLSKFFLGPENPSDSDKLRIMLGAARGLAFLHKKKITHRDIKPLNILISDDGTAKLTDFDLSKFLGGRSQDTVSMHTVHGTEPFYAPEMWMGRREDNKLEEGYHKCVDIFAMGLTFLAVIQGESIGKKDKRYLMPKIEIVQSTDTTNVNNIGQVLYERLKMNHGLDALKFATGDKEIQVGHALFKHVLTEIDLYPKYIFSKPHLSLCCFVLFKI